MSDIDKKLNDLSDEMNRFFYGDGSPHNPRTYGLASLLTDEQYEASLAACHDDEYDDE
jgi:hypothetical protein